MSFKTISRLIAVEAKFATGSQSTGGQFQFTWPALPFIPHRYIVRSYVYDDVVGPGTILVSCTDLYGPVISFDANADALASVACPGTVITNLDMRNLSNQQSTFICTHIGAAVTTLNGGLSIVLELQRD